MHGLSTDLSARIRHLAVKSAVESERSQQQGTTGPVKPLISTRTTANSTMAHNSKDEEALSRCGRKRQSLSPADRACRKQAQSEAPDGIDEGGLHGSQGSGPGITRPSGQIGSSHGPTCSRRRESKTKAQRTPFYRPASCTSRCRLATLTRWGTTTSPQVRWLYLMSIWSATYRSGHYGEDAQAQCAELAANPS